MTELDPSKMGPAVLLSLTRSKRDVALSVPLVQLKSETGLDALITIFSEAFGKDSADRTYEIYEQFGNLKRGSKSMSEYIAQFDLLNSKLIQNKIELPDVLLACKLLYSAELEKRDTRLVLSATSKLEFALIKSSLKRIFSSTSITSEFDYNFDQHLRFKDPRPLRSDNCLRFDHRKPRSTICQQSFFTRTMSLISRPPKNLNFEV